MNLKHIEGKNKSDIVLYTLSTCIWCRKVKELLKTLDVDYYYADVDLLEGEEKEKVKNDIIKWNPSCSFPTLVVNNQRCIVGYQESEIRKLVE